MRTERLLATPPHEGTAHHLTTVVEGPVLLFVGDVVPDEHVDRLIEAFSLLVGHHRPDAHLIVAGSGGADLYSRALRRQVLELNLANAWLIEAVTEPQLVALLRRADLLVSMGDGTGSGETLLDGFAFEVPVMARRVGTVPALVDDAALLLEPDDGIEVAAEAFVELLANARLRAELVTRGGVRLRGLDPVGGS
jgi:glycosyltransferase involved in cell wall biosynthesis